GRCPEKEGMAPNGGDSLDQEEAALLGTEDPSGDKVDIGEHNEEEEERLLGKDGNDKNFDNKVMSDAGFHKELEVSLVDDGNTSKETMNTVEDEILQTNTAETPETTVNVDKSMTEETSNVTTVHELSSMVEQKDGIAEEPNKDVKSAADESSEEIEQISEKSNEDTAQISEEDSKQIETLVEELDSPGELQSSHKNTGKDNALNLEELQTNEVTMVAQDCLVGDTKERTKDSEVVKEPDVADVMDSGEEINSKADEMEHEIDMDEEKVAADNKITDKKDEGVTDKMDEEKEVQKEEDKDLIHAKQKSGIKEMNSENEDVEMTPVVEVDDMQNEKKVESEEMEVDSDDIIKTNDQEKTKDIADSSDVEMNESDETVKVEKDEGETIKEGDKVNESDEAVKVGKDEGETIKEGDKMNEYGETTKVIKESEGTINDEDKKQEQGKCKSKEEKDEEDRETGLKIVGVTSAVAVETLEEKEETNIDELKKEENKDVILIGEEDEKMKDGKEGDKNELKEEGTLDLQIAAVTGGVEMVPDEKRDGPKTVGDGKKEESAKEEKTSSKPLTDDDDDDVIAIKEEKAPVKAPQPPKTTPTKVQQCIVCQKIGKCKYNIVRNGDIKHLCDDNCFKRFRSNPTTFLRPTADNSNSKGSSPKSSTTTNSIANRNNSISQQQVYKTCSVCQLMNIRTTKPFLNWQGMDFCGEECLAKFQGGLNASCSYCASQIPPANKAKFCWRVGNDVKQFCSSPCYSEFVKRLKLCAFCNKDLSSSPDSFMAPVGTQGTFKDFCSQVCLKKFEEKNNKEVELVGMERGHRGAPQGNFTCAVCSKVGPVKHELKLEGKLNRLCSDPCFSAFQYANKLTMNTCDNCGVYCYNEGMQPQYIQFEGQQKKFCSFMCVNTFRTLNKKTVQCAWCSARKSNFDMIERVDANNKYQLFCSLNCLSLYRVNLQATSNQAVTCDQCRKFVPAQYHLTMSDASVRNFCSYSCVMAFQAQFTQPASANKQTTHPVSAQQQVNTRSANRPVTRGVTQQKQQQQQPKPGPASKTTNRPAQQQQSASFPIISNVVSLAPQQGTQQQINLKTTSQVPVIVTTQAQAIKTTANSGNQTIQQQIIIQPPPPKPIKNKSLLCKPFVQTKATSCRPHTQTKECQTDENWEPKKIIIPVPVPIYIPCPMMMYSAPTPFPMPIPIPIPVPCFIPTTKKSATSILKYIKEIQDKIPADPLEAELLMMAEAVAGKESDSESESEAENIPVPDETIVPVEAPTEPLPLPASTGTSTVTNDLGEDMLQMALRMASEMSSEPVMDLENSLTPVPVNTGPRGQSIVDEEDEEDDFQRTTRSTRRGGRKRTSSSRGNNSKASKRQRIESKADDLLKTSSPSPQAPAPPPDANMHLKYTYGVNAWKHWVIQKNTQLEAVSKGSGKLKMFKTDLLQCTPDELNYSLCLFVKEVRKPNGEEYAVDSIYYLCLGIQQYLFENGRIDNIFTDVYYEKFTECLNEVLQKYEPKLNPQGQLVCRIEEEHLWECKQLGAHSPHVLLNSLVYFNTKYFMLKTSEDHLKLSFTHIMKHWKKANTPTKGTGLNAGRHVYLRYYCPTPQTKGGESGKKKKEEMPVYEQAENLENPLRCPVKLYEFYLSKCPESIKNRNDMFYLVPERSCVPDSPVWYSTQSQTIDVMTKMLNRVRLVREIQESNLHTQPIYI
ncbi:hypothetical protein ACJMK2_027804, partial [Sinanodonta woodiana]